MLKLFLQILKELRVRRKLFVGVGCVNIKFINEIDDFLYH